MVAEAAGVKYLSFHEDIQEFRVVIGQREGQRSEVVDGPEEGSLLLQHSVQLVLNTEVASAREVVHPPFLPHLVLPLSFRLVVDKI